MGEVLNNAYEEAENIKDSNEYRFLAKMFTELYAEKEALKSKVRLLSEQNLRLLTENTKLNERIKNGK